LRRALQQASIAAKAATEIVWFAADDDDEDAEELRATLTNYIHQQLIATLDAVVVKTTADGTDTSNKGARGPQELKCAPPTHPAHYGAGWTAVEFRSLLDVQRLSEFLGIGQNGFFEHFSKEARDALTSVCVWSSSFSSNLGPLATRVCVRTQ
jgi:hypothetical protein